MSQQQSQNESARALTTKEAAEEITVTGRGDGEHQPEEEVALERLV